MMPTRLLFSAVAAAAFAREHTVAGTWRDATLPPDERARSLLGHMNFTEKTLLLHGNTAAQTGCSHGGMDPSCYVGYIAANERLGIPALRLEDGPSGVADHAVNVTKWPGDLHLASMWDPALIREFGVAVGKEHRIKGVSVMLGPGVCLTRVPTGGRNWEYAGEDPFLAYANSKAIVQGVQSTGVIACAKHFVDNNQEGPGRNGRLYMSVNVSERAQHELYFEPFRGAVDGGAGAVMCSYNRIGNVYACENKHTLTDGLKGEMGFKGFVVSDWGGTHSTALAAASGLDMEMSGSEFFTEQALLAANVSVAQVDEMAFRILRSMFTAGLFERASEPGGEGSLAADARSDAHRKLALKLAVAGTVLLRNDGGFLPLQKSSTLRVAVIGDEFTALGGEAGQTGWAGRGPDYLSTPAQALARLVGIPLRSVAACEVEDGVDYSPFSDDSDPNMAPGYELGGSFDDCVARCTRLPWCAGVTWNSTLTRCYHATASAPKRTNPNATTAKCALPMPTHALSYTPLSAGVAAAMTAAAAADIVLLSVATQSAEGNDRPTLGLGHLQENLIDAVLSHSSMRKVVVVVRAPGAVTMPWSNHPSLSALLLQFMPGQAAGEALAAILFGESEPLGRLPITFPHSETDGWLENMTSRFPGVNDSAMWDRDHSPQDVQADYSEELLMGYKYYDAKRKNPLWPFGHGLGYANWSFTDLNVSDRVSPATNATVAFTASHDGRSGSRTTTAQLYLSFPESAGEPPQLLRGFTQVSTGAGTSTRVSLTLCARDVSVWSSGTTDGLGGWVQVPGTFGVAVGTSSRVHLLRGSLTSVMPSHTSQ